MKKVLLAVLAILMCLVGYEIFHNRPQPVLNNMYSKGLLSSEEGTTLKYTGYFMGVIPMVDVAIIQEDGVFYDNKPAIKMDFIVTPLSPIFDFFKGRVTMTSMIDAKEKHALKFTEHVYVPGSIDEKKEVFYDQVRHTMKIADGEERETLPHTQDSLSMMYFLRHKDFEEGQELDLNVNTNQKNYRFLTKVNKKEIYSIGDTKISVLSTTTEIRRRDKSRRNVTKMSLWLTEGNKVPFLIKVFTSGLLIVFRLNYIS
ncbi:MAG: DUF3108 domain-containing protein [Candidatus Aceula meridiana]|nr:DUF3108 domain-containing protein [Candidatus Aceula meridiana]